MTKVGYIFPGQGAQFPGMGQDLYAHFEEAKAVYDRANELLGFDVKRIRAVGYFCEQHRGAQGVRSALQAGR